MPKLKSKKAESKSEQWWALGYVYGDDELWVMRRTRSRKVRDNWMALDHGHQTAGYQECWSIRGKMEPGAVYQTGKVVAQGGGEE